MLVFAASICRLALESEERRKWSKLILFCVQDILLQLRSHATSYSRHISSGLTLTHNNMPVTIACARAACAVGGTAAM